MAAPHLWQFHFFAICIGDGAGGIVVNPLAICRLLCIAAFIVHHRGGCGGSFLGKGHLMDGGGRGMVFEVLGGDVE